MSPRMSLLMLRLPVLALAAAALFPHVAGSQLPGSTDEVHFVTTDPDGADYGPQFSPDSRRLIFERYSLAGGGRLLSPSPFFLIPTRLA
jgi:hypothetical protein